MYIYLAYSRPNCWTNGAEIIFLFKKKKIKIFFPRATLGPSASSIKYPLNNNIVLTVKNIFSIHNKEFINRSSS